MHVCLIFNIFLIQNNTLELRSGNIVQDKELATAPLRLHSSINVRNHLINRLILYYIVITEIVPYCPAWRIFINHIICD